MAMRLLSRRALFAAPLALAPAAAGAQPSAVQINPAGPASLLTTAVEGERFRMTFAGWPLPIELPARRARLLAAFPLAGREVLAAAFAGDRSPAEAVEHGRLDLVALIGSDGAALRVLGVEMLSWQGPGGASFDTMLDAPGHGVALRLARVATPPERATRSFHLIWSDYLAWRQGGPLADAAPRPPRPGTWQAALARIRGQVAALLVPPCTTLTLNLLAPTGLLDPQAEIIAPPG